MLLRMTYIQLCFVEFIKTTHAAVVCVVKITNADAKTNRTSVVTLHGIFQKVRLVLRLYNSKSSKGTLEG